MTPIEEPPLGSSVRIVSANSWNGLTFQRRATDDPSGRDAWFGVDNEDGGLWDYLEHRAGDGGRVELIDGPSGAAVVESVEEWNPRVARFRDAEMAARFSGSAS